MTGFTKTFPKKVALFTRAWIEISRAYRRKQSDFVALFTRAWIEIIALILRSII